ncbi:unnamed protein product [Staurois parvus]|uniref:Uncharacterized protein n=1 Tax=Staurois parvus TaxID=386267 RepID=A0ABN9HUD0_9NEOB|nr:unnamed protein product [Staurois parvus]
MQSGMYHSPGNRQTQTHIHRIARQRTVIRHSREHISTTLQSSGGVLYTTACGALHCTL